MIADLKALGADEIIDTSTENPVKRVKEITDGKGVACILEAVAGPAAAQLLPCLSSGGKMMVYGSLSLQEIPLNAGVLIFKEISIQGFWLTTWVRRADPAHKKEVFANTIQLLATGKIQLPVEATYGLDQIAEAVVHADAPGRTGKVLIKP
jgi:NADPH:quinone reductase-like Zn-dependent oxidoreductase